jgi:hypothetical protein
MTEAYDDALRNRLATIDSFGAQANVYAQQAAAARQAQAAAQQQAQWNSANSYASQPNFSSPSLGGARGNSFESFLRAIAKRESGGNYHARNRDSGALGKYQIMPGNIPQWSKQALGFSINENQFYNSPSYQEKIAQYQLRRYYNQFGPAGAAVAWYAGPGNAKKYVRQNGRGFNAPQGKYSSISAYALGILRDMGLR